MWESRGEKPLLICASEYYLNVLSTQTESIVLRDQCTPQKLGNLTYQHLNLSRMIPYMVYHPVVYENLFKRQLRPCRYKEIPPFLIGSK